MKKAAEYAGVDIYYDNVLHRLIDLASEQAGLPQPFKDMKPSLQSIRVQEAEAAAKRREEGNIEAKTASV